MATKTWVGTDAGNEGDWATAANWSPSGVPVDTDDVYLISGSQDVTAGFDQSLIALTSLTIGGTYTGEIGDSVDDLRISAATTRIAYTGTGEIYLAGDMDTIYIGRNTGQLFFGNDTPAECDIDNLYLIGPQVLQTVEIGDSSTLNNLYVQSAHNAQVTVGASVASIALIEIDSGQVACGSAATALTVHGGILTHTAGAVTTATLEGLGILKYNGSGTLTTLNGFGGTFSLAQNYSTSLTIANATLHTGAKIDLRNGLNNTTFTNDILLLGGEVLWDFGALVNQS